MAISGLSYEVQYVDQVTEGGEIWAVYENFLPNEDEAMERARAKTALSGCKTAVVRVARQVECFVQREVTLAGKPFEGFDP